MSEGKQFENLPTTSGPMPTGAFSMGAGGGGVPAERADSISREIATIQGKIATAKYFPRDLVKTQQKVQAECERRTMAEMAEYAFPRGDGVVVGATVSLIRMIARNMGNVEYGWKVIHEGEGYSDVEARVWDMENNVGDSRTFRVLHVRETRNGNRKLTSPRDIYEIVANMAARRVRSLLSEIIPAYIIEDARETCKETLARDEKSMTREQKIEALAKAFRSAAVTVEMVEKRLGHKMVECSLEEINDLRTIYASLREKATYRGDWFEVGDEKTPSEPESATLDTSAKPEPKPAMPKKPAPAPAPAPKPKPAPAAAPPVQEPTPTPVEEPAKGAPLGQQTDPPHDPETGEVQEEAATTPNEEEHPPPPTEAADKEIMVGPCKFTKAYYPLGYCQACNERKGCPAHQAFVVSQAQAGGEQKQAEQAKAENAEETKKPLDMTKEEMEEWRKSTKGMSRKRHTEQPPGEEKWLTAGITREDFLFLRAIPEGHPARGLIDRRLAEVGYFYESDGLSFLREVEGVNLAKAVRLAISGEES